MLNPNEAYVSLSKTSGCMLRNLGVFSCDEDADEMKRCILGAEANGNISVVDSTRELHYLARAVLRGCECYLLCVTTAGSPAGNLKYTTIIKGVMRPDDAIHLIKKNKGLAPIGRSFGRTS